MTEPFGRQLPDLRTEVPGPASRALSDRLAQVESRNVTWRAPDFPVFWEEALGANVRDADGNVFLDLTSAFGVALGGHRDSDVVAAIQAQSGRLLHGMGDVHPPTAKVEFLEVLAEVLPWLDARSVMTTGGAEAVEIALKTAHLRTGRPGVIAFRGGYHGLTGGALAATHRPYFREPFAEVLGRPVAWLPFPEDGSDQGAEVLHALEAAVRGGIPGSSERPGIGGVPVGAFLVEPVQARGGVRVLSSVFADRLREIADAHGIVVIADEIYSGLGRCGAALASDRVGLRPDLVCLGKALGGGVPIGVCAGPASVMDAWPESPGEALHTSTFLGHPVIAAAGIAALRKLQGGDLLGRVARVGDSLRARLGEALSGLPVSPVRGLGLLLGFDLLDDHGRARPGGGVEVARAALRRGVILLPAGDHGEVVELSPPAILTEGQLTAAVERVRASVQEVA